MNTSVTLASKTATQRTKQAGLGLLGLIFWLGIIGFVGMLAAKSFPAWSEYAAINRAIGKIETQGETDIRSAQRAFDRYAQVDNITTLRGSDIEFVKGPRGLVGRYSYEARIPIFGNAYLLFEFANQP